MSIPVKPTLDHIIVKRDVLERTLASGIVIPDNFAEQADQGTVLAVGPGLPANDGTIIPLNVKPGDRILFSKLSGYNVVVADEEYLVLKDMNVFAIINPHVDEVPVPEQEDLQPYAAVMSRLTAVGASVMFRFVDNLSGSKRMFSQSSGRSGIIVTARKDEQRDNRWGQVISAGPDSDVSVGEYIYIEGSMWSNATKIEDMEVWKTENMFIIMTTTDVKLTEQI